MEQLPIEILTQILKYLNLADRRECALTCKKFYEATLDPDLHWNLKYCFDAEALLPEEVCQEDDDIYGFCCKSPNLYIHNLEENINVKSLLNPNIYGISLLGPNVVSLSLKGSSILEGSFVEIIKKCESLEALDITRCNSLFMTGAFLKHPERLETAAKVLETTTTLNLSAIRYLTDDILKTFISLCPSLSSLSLASCNILFSEFGSMQRFALTFPRILNLISSRISTLTCIDLSRTNLTNDSLKELASLKGLKLKEVVFQCCRDIGDSGIVALSKKQTNLQVIDIRDCFEVGDSGVSAICSCLSNLRKLYLAKCKKITDASASKISFLEKLQVLDISECYGVTTKSISIMLTLLPQLTTLLANGCDFGKFHNSLFQKHQIDNDIMDIKGIEPKKSFMKEMLCFDHLTTLSINSGKHVTDSTIQNIFLYFTNLESLSFSWCHHITDRGLLGLDVSVTDTEGRILPNVEKTNTHILSTARYSLTHGRSGFLTSPGKEFLSHVDWNEVDVGTCMINRGIVRLRNLQRLSMSNCPNITEESFIRIFCAGAPSFPNMQKLELNMMQRCITDDVINGISIQCPLLTKLAISCSNVTDKVMDSLTIRMSRLEILNISNCDNITPSSFTGLIRNCKWLRELDISSCKLIPAASAEKLRKSLPLLVKIHTRYSGV